MHYLQRGRGNVPSLDVSKNHSVAIRSMANMLFSDYRFPHVQAKFDSFAECTNEEPIGPIDLWGYR